MLSSFRQKKKSRLISLPLCLLKTAALRYYKALLLLILPPVFIGILNSTAYADITLEFYTYGSFDEVVKAFEKAALIFSDRNYTTLFPTLIGIGILFIACSIAFGGGGGRGSATLISALIGVTLFTSLVVPKGTMHVYDPVKNRYKAVGSVPDGLVLIAGLTNLVERSMIDIVTTSGDPVGYQTQSGGIGFDFLYNVHSKGIILADEYIHRNLSEYTSNCLFFELLRPGTTLSANEIAKNNDFRAVYAKAASPAIYTQIYRDEDGWREGQSQTCQEAWAAINVQISQNATFEKATKARCADIGFDPTIPDEMSQCRTMITDFVSWFEGAAWEPVGFFRQTLLAQTYYDSLISASPDVALAQMASKNTGTGYLASGMMANQWIPIIRGVLIGASILLTPFLVLFFPTSLVWRATALITGLFLWIMSWGIIDALLHSYAMDRAYKVFEEIRAYELGAEAVAMFGTSSLKSLAFFGAMRWGGLALATIVTGMIIKQGGSALSKLGGSLASSAQSESAKAGIQTQTPEGVGSSLNSMVSSSAAVSFAGGNKWDSKKWSQRTQAAENSMSKDFGSGLGMGNMDSAQSYGFNKTSMDVAGTKGTIEAYGNNMDKVADVAAINTGQKIGAAEQIAPMGKAVGFKGSNADVAKQWGAFERGGMQITEPMAKHLQSQKWNVQAGQKITEMAVDSQGNITSLKASQSGQEGAVITADGIKTNIAQKEDGHGNILRKTDVTDATTGKFISSSATGQTMGSYSLKGHDGKSFEIEKGAEMKAFFDSEGNIARTEYAGITGEGKNAKKGTISVDSSGKAVWTSMDGGHQTNLKDIDNKTREKMNRSNWGSQAISHNEAKHVGSFWEKDSVSGKFQQVYGEQNFAWDKENKKLVYVGGNSSSGVHTSKTTTWRGKDGLLKKGIVKGVLDTKTGALISGGWDQTTSVKEIMHTDKLGSHVVTKIGDGQSPSDSAAYETSMSGRSIKVEDTFKYDTEKNFSSTPENAIVGSDDPREMSDLKTYSFMGVGIVKSTLKEAGVLVGKLGKGGTPNASGTNPQPLSLPFPKK